MIPPEVRALSDLILPGWHEYDDAVSNDVIKTAWRIHNAGYVKVGVVSLEKFGEFVRGAV